MAGPIEKYSLAYRTKDPNEKFYVKFMSKWMKKDGSETFYKFDEPYTSDKGREYVAIASVTLTNGKTYNVDQFFINNDTERDAARSGNGGSYKSKGGGNGYTQTADADDDIPF